MERTTGLWYNIKRPKKIIQALSEHRYTTLSDLLTQGQEEKKPCGTYTDSMELQILLPQKGKGEN